MSVSTRYSPAVASDIMPIAIPATGLAIGTPASMSANVPAHTDAIEVLPLLANDSQTMRMEREQFFGGDDRAQSFFRQSAVAYHAAVHTADAAGLADRERGKVVMQHKALFAVLYLDAVDNLRGFGAPERERAENVRRSEIKQPRAVYHRRDAAGFGVERADFVHRAAVDALALFDGKLVHVRVQAVLKVGVELGRLDIGELRRRVRRPLLFKRSEVILFKPAAFRVDERHDDFLKHRCKPAVVLKRRHEWGFFDSTFFNYFLLPGLNLFYLFR